MTNIYDPFKAAEIAGAQGRAIGFTAGLYSTAGLSNIAAPSVEVLNQNGYSIYQTDNGIQCKQDRDTKNGSVWTSDSLGVTFDYTGDTLSITPSKTQQNNSSNQTQNVPNGQAPQGQSTQDDANQGQTTEGEISQDAAAQGQAVQGQITQGQQGYTENQAQQNPIQTNNYPYFSTNFGNSSSLADNSINSFNQNGQQILNQLDASGKNPNVGYNDLSGIKENETVDAMTGEVVDKEKDAKIDKIKNKKSSQYKFNKIAELINKVYKAQNAEKQSPAKGAGAVNIAGGLAAGAGIGALVGGPVGAVVGGIAGLIGGIFATSSDAKDAKAANAEAAKNSEALADELKTALSDLLKDGNEEEFIAFERYYYEINGGECDLSQVLQDLEINDDSSDIAKASGFDSEYLVGVLDKIDETNEYLTPEELEETKEADTPAANNTYNPQTEILKQKTELYYQAWLNSLSTGEATLMGETKKSAEWEKLYIDTYNQWQETQAQ